MKRNIQSQRQLRVGQQLKHLISEVIIMGDFQSEKVRETLITVTEVNVSPDLKKANVFVVSRDNKKNFIKNLIFIATNYYKNKIVKLIVENKTRIPEFETFLDRLYKSNPIDLIILEDLSEYTARYADDEGEDLEVGNTATFLNEYVDSMPDDNVKDEERKKVKRLLQVIYDEALNIDD